MSCHGLTEALAAFEGFGVYDTLTVANAAMDCTLLYQTQEKMAFLAALFDCINDIPAIPDLAKPSLTTAEYMLLACRLGWLPLCPMNR